MLQIISWLTSFLLLTLLNPLHTQATNPPFYDILKTSWNYHKIFDPQDIPLPATVAGIKDAHIKAVYSPSVIYFQERYLMFFGISLYCQNNTVARDSIGLATSLDGINWKFERYIIEPDSRTCTIPTHQWSKDMLFQVNDPAAIVSGDQIIIFFTTVIWPNDHHGNIGVVHLNRFLQITYQNNTYLPGDNQLSNAGYSRPAIQQISPSKEYRLWVDSGGKVGSIAINSFTQLNPSFIKNENLNGVDINLPTLSYDSEIILFNDAPIKAISRIRGASAWSNRWTVTSLSGQDWDSWYQGSPDLIISHNSCKLLLYYAGAIKDQQTGFYKSLSIGLATPKNSTTNLPICTSNPSPSPKPGDLNGDGKVDLADFNLLISKFGNPYTLMDFNNIIANFGK